MAAMTAPPAPEWPAVLARWSVEPPVVALLILAAVAYSRGRRQLGEAGRRDRASTAYGAGLGVVAVALLSPVATYAEALLSVHMVQHLLLVLVAAPLLVGAHSVPALLANLPERWASRVRAIGQSRAGRALTHPVVAWGIFAATAWAVHFSPLFDAALEHPPVHAAEHCLFLASGLLFWHPVAGQRALSYPLRLLYLALAMPQNTFLALAIFSAGQPLYDAYVRLARSWGPSVLDDQRQGGGLMWVAGDLTLLVAVLAVAAAWAAHDAGEEVDQGAEPHDGAGAPRPRVT
jgi:cytochrome c oxidase assembly factor CtaG